MYNVAFFFAQQAMFDWQVPFDIDFSKDFLEGKKPLIPITDEDLEVQLQNH